MAGIDRAIGMLPGGASPALVIDREQLLIPLVIVACMMTVVLGMGLLIGHSPALWRRIRVGLRLAWRRQPIRTAMFLLVPLLSLITLPVVIAGDRSNKPTPVVLWLMVPVLIALVVFAGASYCRLGRYLQDGLRTATGARRLVFMVAAALYALGLVPGVVAVFLVVGVVLAGLGVL